MALGAFIINSLEKAYSRGESAGSLKLGLGFTALARLIDVIQPEAARLASELPFLELSLHEIWGHSPTAVLKTAGGIFHR